MSLLCFIAFLKHPSSQHFGSCLQLLGLKFRSQKHIYATTKSSLLKQEDIMTKLTDKITSVNPLKAAGNLAARTAQVASNVAFSTTSALNAALQAIPNPSQLGLPGQTTRSPDTPVNNDGDGQSGSFDEIGTRDLDSQDRKKRGAMLRHRRESKMVNDVIDLLNDAFEPTVPSFRLSGTLPWAKSKQEDRGEGILKQLSGDAEEDVKAATEQGWQEEKVIGIGNMKRR